MKTTIALDKAILVSELKMEELKRIEKFNPEALCMYDADGEPMFKVATGEKGSVSKYGVTFDKVSSKGCAAVEVEVCGETEAEKKQYLAEEFGGAIRNIKDVEAGLAECLKVIDESIKEIVETTAVIA